MTQLIKLKQQAITKKTKAIVPVHYAGVACEMDVIMDIANRHGLYVIEDAAQGMMSTYKGRPLGSIGHLGAYSFHETKNFTSGGEGGLLIINDEKFVSRSEIIREKGTNRSQFFRGQINKYNWVDIGSSYLPSELQAAYLWGQLEKESEIIVNRLGSWNTYNNSFSGLIKNGFLESNVIPESCKHNAHMFFLKLNNLAHRTRFIEHLRSDGIQAVFHYIPLHSSPSGKSFGVFNGEDRNTTIESERLVRLPLYYGLNEHDVSAVSNSVMNFFK